MNRCEPGPTTSPFRTVPLAVLLTSTLGYGAAAGAQGPLFDATADIAYDMLRPEDNALLDCVRFQGEQPRVVWDKRVDGEPRGMYHVYDAHYLDGSVVELAINSELGSPDDAEPFALRYAEVLGHLPPALLGGVERFSFHPGGEGFHGGAGQIVFYRQTAERRAEDDKIEESMFHEAVHAAWDARYATAPEWVKAQKADGWFATEYAAAYPEREDLAESALLVHTLLRHPRRIGEADRDTVENRMSHRIRFVGELLDSGDGWQAEPRLNSACETR